MCETKQILEVWRRDCRDFRVSGFPLHRRSGKQGYYVT